LELLPGGSYLVRAKPDAAGLTYKEISDHLRKAVSLLASRQKTADPARPSAELQTGQDST
jgi:RNase P protein component